MPEGPPSRLRLLTTSANGQPALAVYGLDPDEGFVAIALDVLTLDRPRIAAVTAFRTPALFPSFGLPVKLS